MQGVAEDEGKLLLKTQVWVLKLRLPALDALSALTVEDTPEDPFSTPPQLDGDLITLTLLPRSRWQTLLNLEVIQVSPPASLEIATNSLWHSNEINRRNLPKPQSKPPSSSPLCQASNRGSHLNKKRRERSQKKTLGGCSKLRPVVRASSLKN